MVILLTFLCYFGSCELLKDRIVNVSMSGSWKDTSLLAEAAAFIADANGEAYWTFIHGLEKANKYPESIEDIKSYALDFLSEELRALMELALVTRAYSPRIHMFRQISSSFTTDFNKIFVVYCGVAYFSIVEFKNAMLEHK